MKLGTILKLKGGTSTNQMFIIVTSTVDDDNVEFFCVVIFNNLTNDMVGDPTKGYLSSYDISSIRELSDFIVTNNY